MRVSSPFDTGKKKRRGEKLELEVGLTLQVSLLSLIKLAALDAG